MAGIGHNQKNFVSVNSLTSEQKDDLKNVIVELNNSYLRVSSEREYQKESIGNISDKLGLDKKLVRRMAKAYYKSSFSQEIEENSEFEDFYNVVINKQTT
jgi:DNA-directed RNA polymerase subunit N (RpoN/RPB10)